MFEYKIGDYTIKIEDPKLRGYKGAEVLSLIKDLSKKGKATLLFNSEDERMRELVDLEVKRKYETDNKAKDKYTDEIGKLLVKNARFYEELESSIGLSFKDCYPVVEEVLKYFNCSEELLNADLYQLFDLYLILEYIAKEPSNNLALFLKLLQSQMIT
jgi:hypothetical protein